MPLNSKWPEARSATAERSVQERWPAEMVDGNISLVLRVAERCIVYGYGRWTFHNFKLSNFMLNRSLNPPIKINKDVWKPMNLIQVPCDYVMCKPSFYARNVLISMYQGILVPLYLGRIWWKLQSHNFILKMYFLVCAHEVVSITDQFWIKCFFGKNVNFWPKNQFFGK